MSNPTSPQIGSKCPACGLGELIEKEGKFGTFLGCTRYPQCRGPRRRRAQPKPKSARDVLLPDVPQVGDIDRCVGLTKELLEALEKIQSGASRNNGPEPTEEEGDRA